MRKRLWLSVLALGLLSTAAQADPVRKKMGLTYNLLLKQGDSFVSTSVLDGLESGDSFRLKVKPGQKCYAYVVAQRSPDKFRLLFPNHDALRGKNQLPRKAEFVWPTDGWLRLDGHKGTERMYLILSAERIYELEARFALADKSFPESVLLDIRDRYHAENNFYRRQIDDDGVHVKFKSRERPAVLIEEITLRHM